MKQKKKFSGMKLTESPLYTRLRLDAARLGHPGIIKQVEGLKDAPRQTLSLAVFQLSEILHDRDSYDLDKVKL